MAEESSGEKTLAPTAKRLREAAKNGDVLRSKDLGVAVGVIAGAAFLQIGGPWLLKGLAENMRMGFTWNRQTIDDFTPAQMIMAMLWHVAPPLLALGLVMVAVAIITQPSPGGRFMMGNIAPKASRINPMSGITRIFGPTGWIEAGKGTLKVLLLGTIAWYWAKSRLDTMVNLGAVGLSGQIAFAWSAITSLLYQLAGGLVIIAAIDFPINWLRRIMRLRMSLQDVKDENKEAEGSPEAKSARKGRQRQIAMGAIAGAMKKAQFVITNPTHFAVAVTWDPDLAPAPVVLAKGRGEKALAIRELAAENNLPCIEIPALARSLYYTTRERQMIREELYVAVAGVLSFVMALSRGEARHLPQVDVPVALRFDADGRADPEDRYRPDETP
jgi:flagellar biosynthetic protein FlhB